MTMLQIVYILYAVFIIILNIRLLISKPIGID